MSLRFGRTQDAALIRHMITDPKVWKWMAEDGTLPEDYDPVISEKVYYVIAADEHLIGLFIFVPRSSVEYEAHFAVMPSAWARAVPAALGVIEWAFANIAGLQCISGGIPADNTHATRLVKKIGMRLVGVKRSAFLRGGKLLEVRMVEITKEDACQQPQLARQSA